jgi:hypothetical protein
MFPAQNLPDANRVSVLTATVLLAFAITRLIDAPDFGIILNVLGAQFSFQLDISAFMIFMAAGLTAAGMDWLLRAHPAFVGARRFEHWLLPALTALLLGITLYSLPGVLWWAGFVVGGILLVIVVLAEYIAVDRTGALYAFATPVLVTASLLLYLVLAFALQTASARLLVLAFALFPAAALVSLRVLHLRLGRWEWQWALGIGLVSLQIAAALHYLPLSPTRFALGVFAPLYMLIVLATNVQDEISPRRALLEPLFILAASVALAIWLG